MKSSDYDGRGNDPPYPTAEGSGGFECNGCGAVFIVTPKVGCDIDDVEYCPVCGSGSLTSK